MSEKAELNSRADDLERLVSKTRSQAAQSAQQETCSVDRTQLDMMSGNLARAKDMLANCTEQMRAVQSRQQPVVKCPECPTCAPLPIRELSSAQSPVDVWSSLLPPLLLVGILIVIAGLLMRYIVNYRSRVAKMLA